jgi:hypothetical protein
MPDSNPTRLCECGCGTPTKIAKATDPRRGHVRGQPVRFVYGHQSRMGHGHGHPSTPTYGSWRSMLQRCENPNSIAYHNYGGRDIKVCERWKTFENFLADMGERPKGKTLDRYPNNDGDYEPGNCRWATPKQQAKNSTRANVLIAFGEEKTLLQWSKDARCVVTYRGLLARASHGWQAERALTEPPMPANHPSRKTHCKHGHPLSGDNLYLYTYKGKQWRACKACKAARKRDAQ